MQSATRLHSVPAISGTAYSLYNAPNNRIEFPDRCESVQSKDPQQTSSDRQTKSICSQRVEDERKREREEEEPQSVKHNLITPSFHGYTWTHRAADLLVQMMQKQSKGEIFFQALTSFSNENTLPLSGAAQRD